MSTSTYFLHLIQKRSAPVGYAAEYLTCGSLVAIPMGFSLHMFMRVLYHICISIPSGGRSVLPTFWNIWYNCLIKLNALLVRPREYLYIPKDNGLRAGCGNVNLPRPGCGMLAGCDGKSMENMLSGYGAFSCWRENAREVFGCIPHGARAYRERGFPIRLVSDDN